MPAAGGKIVNRISRELAVDGASSKREVKSAKLPTKTSLARDQELNKLLDTYNTDDRDL